MLRSFIILLAAAVVGGSCKKANTDEGQTRSDGASGIPGPPTNEKRYAVAFDMLTSGLSLTTPPPYASPLLLNFEVSRSPNVCLLSKVGASSVFQISQKCPFDQNNTISVVTFRAGDGPTAQKSVPIGMARDESVCGVPGVNRFEELTDPARKAALAAPVKELMGAEGAKGYLNPMTGTILVLVGGNKYLAPAMEACPPATGPKRDQDFAANWRAMTEHDPVVRDLFVDTKQAFFRQNLLGYVASHNKTVEDPFLRPNDESEDLARRTMDDLFAKEMRPAVVARANFFPIAYPVATAPDQVCMGFGLEIKKVLPNELIGFAVRAGQLREANPPVPGRKQYEIADWDVTIGGIEPTANQIAFAHSTFVVGFFSDQFDADAVLALTPAVRVGGPNPPLLYDCSGDPAAPVCGVMRIANEATKDINSCPRFTLL